MNKNLGDQIVALKEQGKTNKEIQQLLKCCKSIISYHTHKKYKSIKKKDICICGREKSIYAERCIICENKLRRDKLLSRSLADIKESTSNKNNPFQLVREQARMLLLETNRTKECAVCGFNEYVEVCHIRPISSFPLETPIKEVNALSNLIYLCPNHHIMLDKGKLNLQELNV